jgi:hypothetical protein
MGKAGNIVFSRRLAVLAIIHGYALFCQEENVLLTYYSPRIYIWSHKK